MTKALQIAIQECNANVVELPGTRHNPRILEYFGATSLHATTDEIPWCASFVNWCLREAGLEGTGSAQSRSFLRWGLTIPLEKIDAGDVVVFSRGNNPQQGHVGFFLEWNRKNHTMNIIGGNQSNRVSNSTFSTQKLIGIK